MDKQLNHYGILGMQWGRKRGTQSKPPKKLKRKPAPFLKSVVKEAWGNMTPGDKLKLGIGAAAGTAILAAHGAIAIRDLKKGKYSFGREVAYEVLDQFGNLIIKKYK